MAPPRGGGAGAGRGSGRSAIRQGDAHTAAAGAAAGPLTRAARRVAARALGMLQDDSPLLSLKIRLLVMLSAFCLADDSAFTLSMYPGRHVGSSSDWLQERIGEGMSLLDTFALPSGPNLLVANPSSPQTRPVCPAGLLMLLRWAASFLPLPARVPFAALAAAAAAHSVAVCSRRALAAGCAGGASSWQKLQAVLLLQLLQLAYWLPAARAVWTLLAALWRCASNGAPLPIEPVLRALALCTLCCERWQVHCELLAITTRMETGAVEACQPMLRASRQLEREFGCWPLHTVRSLLYMMSPQVRGRPSGGGSGLARLLGCRCACTAGLDNFLGHCCCACVQAAPHLAASCTRPPTVARMYALAGAPELATQARRQGGHTGAQARMHAMV